MFESNILKIDESSRPLHQPKSILKKKKNNHLKSILKGRSRYASPLDTVDQLTNALNFGFDPNQPIMKKSRVQKPKSILLEEIDSPKKKRKSVNFPSLDPKPATSIIETAENQPTSQVPNAYNPRNIHTFALTGRRQSQNPHQSKPDSRQKFKVKRGSRSQPRKVDFYAKNKKFVNQNLAL